MSQINPDISKDDSLIKHKGMLQKLVVEENSVFDSSNAKDRPSPRQPLDIDCKSIEKSKEEATLHENSFQSTKAQFRALIGKNFALQSKQRGTNICQTLTPIVCLLFILLLKYLASSKMSPALTFSLPLPYMFNTPYQYLYGKHNPFLNASSYLTFTGCLQWFLYGFEGKDITEEGKKFVEAKNDGMLSYILPPFEDAKFLYYCQQGEFQGLVPYFNQPNATLTVNEHMFRTLKELNTYNFSSSSEVPHLSRLPDGAVVFYQANKNNLTLRLQVNDHKVSGYHRSNGVTKYRVTVSSGVNKTSTKSVMHVFDGQLILMDLVSKAYLSKVVENDDVFLLSGSQPMPESTTSQAIMAKIISIAGGSLYPIALSLLLPVFMHTIVLEKEERLREIMKMNGLKMKNYWIVNYLFSFGLYITTTLIFLFFGMFVLVTDFFTETNFFVLIITLFGWGFSQVSLSFFFQNFIAKAKTAMIMGYLLSIWTTVVGSSFSMIVYPLPSELPIAMRLYPPFAFSRLIYQLTYRCSNFRAVEGFSDFNGEMWGCLAVLYFGAIVFLVLGLYLDAVLPQEYGIRKHPLFFLKFFLKNKMKKSERGKSDEEFLLPDKNENSLGNGARGLDIEDVDVQSEREFVDQLKPPFDNYPLVIKHIRKVYKAIGGKPPKIAVRDFSLHIKKGEMFGLLGPNGAGKTSLISILTGLYPPENGNAWLGGFDIINQIDAVHTQMGVCPQFDLLWPELTVEEHLYFYARIRGVPPKQEKDLVNKALKEVYLSKFATFRTNQLSGGMKRRLSVAISLVGDPKIIFLDEPTTGLDPENRRQLWEILAEAKGDKAMVLTTHSMEEADVLCTRIGIMADGGLRCLGSQTKLKNKFGGGYHLSINCHKDKYLNKFAELGHSNIKIEEECWARLQNYVEKLLPKSELKSSFNGSFIFRVPTEGLEVSKLFEELESKKKELAISDWGISQATLEDVFMEIVETYEAGDEDLN